MDRYWRPSSKQSARNDSMLLRDAEIGSICPETHQLHQRFQLDSHVVFFLFFSFCVERRVAEMSSSATFLEMPSAWYRCWRYETRPTNDVVGSSRESVEDLSGLSFFFFNKLLLSFVEVGRRIGCCTSRLSSSGHQGCVCYSGATRAISVLSETTLLKIRATNYRSFFFFEGRWRALWWKWS